MQLRFPRLWDLCDKSQATTNLVNGLAGGTALTGSTHLPAVKQYIQADVCGMLLSSLNKKPWSISDRLMLEVFSNLLNDYFLQ